MNAYEINHTLSQARMAVDRLMGQGFQQVVHNGFSPWTPQQTKANLEAVQQDANASEAQRALARDLRDQLRMKCGI